MQAECSVSRVGRSGCGRRQSVDEAPVSSGGVCGHGGYRAAVLTLGCGRNNSFAWRGRCSAYTERADAAPQPNTTTAHQAHSGPCAGVRTPSPMRLEPADVKQLARRVGPAVPSLALTVEQACLSLNVSWDFWRANIEPDIALVRIGRRKLVPTQELERWLDTHAEKAVG